MKPLNYIVLRRPFSSDNFGDIPLIGHEAELPEKIERIGVHVEPLSFEQAQQLARVDDGQTLALIRAMPMRLVRPVAKRPPEKPTTTVWGVSAVGAETSKFDGTGIVIAVLDTGIDTKHPAFDGMHLVLKNFTPDPDGDEDGHGTHCAATIFGRDVSGQRIGIARGVKKALIGKVLGTNGGEAAQIIRAIQWAVSEGADIISMSLGFDPVGDVERLMEDGVPKPAAFSLAMQGVLEAKELFDSVARAAIASKPDLVFVVAAGNESARPDFAIRATAPAGGGAEFITVGAVGPGKRLSLAEFSNTGADVVAPGIDIVSAWPGGGLMSQDGTSMAGPHVAGVTALWMEQARSEGRNLSSSMIRARIRGNATMIGIDMHASAEDVGTGIVRAP
jgi:subtilisin family serine protease